MNKADGSGGCGDKDFKNFVIILQEWGTSASFNRTLNCRKVRCMNSFKLK